MLPKPLVEKVAQLLKENRLTQREIASKLGVSRVVVSKISTGRRGLHGRTIKPDEPDTGMPPGRCPTCGGRVYFPCVACEAQAYQLRQKALAQFVRQRRRTPLLRIVRAEVARPDHKTAQKVA